MLLGGDFNARTGKKGGIYEGEDKKRSSKDKICDREGKVLLEVVENDGWHILNGNVDGDEKGEYTFIRKKREVRKLLKKWKEEKKVKEKYLRERMEFRKICERKQKEKAKSKLEEIRKAKTEKEIWRYTNKEKKQRIPIDRKRENMWKKVVGNKDETPDRTQDTSRKEIEKQIKKLKKGKASGKDNIQNEA
ncbi:protein PXR1-like [Frieseomelitta varia]|uniref:protein PXR1-like n=1 Tax=Frieseomelitta varia TaxID=561572 RepID=UPI001CB68E7D|nr:protein PXR1-like [Frieseomelitta varia]